MAKKLVSINLDEDLIRELDAVSESVGMSRSGFVNLVLRATCMGETSEVSSILLRAALATSASDESRLATSVE